MCNCVRPSLVRCPPTSIPGTYTLTSMCFLVESFSPEVLDPLMIGKTKDLHSPTHHASIPLGNHPFPRAGTGPGSCRDVIGRLFATRHVHEAAQLEDHPTIVGVCHPCRVLIHPSSSRRRGQSYPMRGFHLPFHPTPSPSGNHRPPDLRLISVTVTVGADRPVGATVTKPDQTLVDKPGRRNEDEDGRVHEGRWDGPSCAWPKGSSGGGHPFK
jgi:hypothetical protein